jgi:hypothetical protein
MLNIAEISEAMKADLERFKQRQGAPVSSIKEEPTQVRHQHWDLGAGWDPLHAHQGTRVHYILLQGPGAASPFAGLKDNLDKLLIADFFLVLAALAWLAVAVAVSSITGDKETPLLTIWYALWPTLWQSALGLLMAGALVSGGLGKLAEQQGKGKQ